MADESEPAAPPSYLNEPVGSGRRPPQPRSPPSTDTQRKRRRDAADSDDVRKKHRGEDSNNSDDSAARSIVNQKVQKRRTTSAAAAAAARPRGTGLFTYEEDVDPGAAAAAAVRPFDPPSALNDLVPAVVPSCFKEDEWLYDLEQEEKFSGEARPFCYLCKFGQEPGDEDENPFYKRLEDTWVDLYGTMKDMELAELVYKLYEDDIRPHTKAGPTWDARPEWKVSTIYRHFTDHAMNDMISNRWVRTQYDRMLRVARESLVELETATGTRRLNMKAVKTFMDIDKRRQSLVSTNALAGGGGGGRGGGMSGTGAPLTSNSSSAKAR